MRLRRHAITTAMPLLLAVAVLVYRGPGWVWARTHFGDTLAVAFLVGAFGLITRWQVRTRLALVGVVAAAVELAQLSEGAADRSAVVQLLIGGHFDPLDFVYYAAGLVLAFALERVAA